MERRLISCYNSGIVFFFSNRHVARFAWLCVFFAFNVLPPRNAKDILGNWLRGAPWPTKILILFGASVLYWSIWNYRNDRVFNHKKLSNIIGYLHVFQFTPFLGTMFYRNNMILCALVLHV